MSSFRKLSWNTLFLTMIAASNLAVANGQVESGTIFDTTVVASFSDRTCCDHSHIATDIRSPSRSAHSLGTLTSFLGIDGSKQPQDFGANANLGLAGQIGYAAPLIPRYGIGFQVGARASFTGNAVQVYELLDESVDRFQNFTTVGLFHRSEHGIGVGLAYDYLSQDSFDNFTLGQWRIRASYDLNERTEIGVTVNLSDRGDSGSFNDQSVELEPVEQLHVYVRRQWKTGVHTSLWIGVADKHSEENVITGTLPPKTNQILYGAEVFAPLNDFLAIYGETNLIMPADTGAVDAYLGIQFSHQGIRRSRSRRNRYREYLPVASNPTFTNDLTRW